MIRCVRMFVMLVVALCAGGGRAIAGDGRKAVLFDGEVRASSGVSLSFSRNFAVSTLKDGTLAASYAPSFSEARTLLGAPNPITLDTDATALNQVFGGTWTDGVTPVVVHYRQKSSPNSAYVNIWVNPAIATNCFSSEPASRSVNIRCAATGNKTTALVDLLKGSPDEDASWVYAPFAFSIVGGEIIAVCEAQTWTGSAWQARAVGFIRWDEAAGNWRLVYRGKTRNNGLTRGREWVTSQYWILDGQTLPNSREVMLTWVDYGVNPNSNGGQVHICRMTRAATTDAWTLGSIIMLYEATDSGNHHFHNAFAYRPASTTAGVVVGLSVGDSNMAELVAFHRTDASTYTQGWDSGTGAMTATATDGGTSNGWTTVREVAGEPSTTSSSPAVGWAQWMGVAPLGGETTKFVVSNDEGLNPVFFMHMPDFFAGETNAWFELPAYEPIPAPTFRRGRLAFGIWSDTSLRQDYITVALKNSSAQSSVAPSFGDSIVVAWAPASGAFLQGFSASVGTENARALYSRDGRDWSIWFSPGAAVRPCVAGRYALVGGLSSFGKILAYPFPSTVRTRPLLVGPATANYQITSAASAEAAATGNTVTTIASNAFGVADGIVTGRTIPAPPSNGPVVRWSVGPTATSKYGGTRTLTTGTPLLISDRDPSGGATFQYVTVGFWVYALPPSVPFGGENVAPYNSPRSSFRVQVLRAGTSSASPAGAGDVDSVDGAGWRYFTYTTTTQQWGADIAANANVGFRLTDNASGATNMDVLICFDRVQLSASAQAVSVQPMPVAASASTGLSADRAVLGGFAPTSNWSVTMAGFIPASGWDQYLSTAYLPSNPTIAVLVDGSGRTITCRADLSARRLVFTDGTNTLNLAPNSGEQFVFERGTPIILSGSSSGADFKVTASVGGTTAASGTLTLASPVRPSSIVLADESYANIAAMEWAGVEMDEDTAMDQAARERAVRTLEFIERGVPERTFRGFRK